MAGTASSMLKSAMEKHSSLKKETIANNNGDLISWLPDAVLCHILSFVPTKKAVATSVLSKRWKLLWTSVPNLDFSSWYHSFEHTTKFMKFVDRVLRENNVSRVRKVHLHCNRNCDPSRVKAWTNAIAWRDAEYFDLKLPLRCRIENPDEISSIISLPDSFFSRGQNLVELRLERIGLKVPTSVDFPCLKTIDFDSVQFLGDDSMKNLLSGCPILKSLDIHRSEWDNAQTLHICSASLGDLLLHTIKCTNKDFGYKVVIDAPNLSKLMVTDHVDVDYDMNDLSSLKEVYVSVETDRIARDEEFYAKRLFDLLRNISHLEELVLSARTMRFLENTNFEHLPMFKNLTRLKVELVHNCWPILPYLLNCSPNLVSFYVGLNYLCPDIEWHEPQHVPKCLLSNLEEIQFKPVEDYDAVMEMIIYFLNNAMVLKKMDITSFDFDLDQETNIRKQLLEFPRSGSNCQIEYYNQKFPRDEWMQ